MKRIERGKKVSPPEGRKARKCQMCRGKGVFGLNQCWKCFGTGIVQSYLYFR